MQNDSVDRSRSASFEKLEKRLLEISEHRSTQDDASFRATDDLEAEAPTSEFQRGSQSTHAMESDHEPLVRERLLENDSTQEVRDEDWAGPLESHIENAVNQIPNLSRSHHLFVICKTTRCEATGRLYVNVPEYEFLQSIEYIEAGKFGHSLGNANVMVAEVDVDRKTGSFAISFDRMRAAAGN
jgi:hypothetical protein